MLHSAQRWPSLGLVSVMEVHGIGDEKSATHLSALHASGECRERST